MKTAGPSTDPALTFIRLLYRIAVSSWGPLSKLPR